MKGSELHEKRVLVTGASGFLGHHLLDVLKRLGVEPITPSHAEYDLTEQAQVRQMFTDHRPEVVFNLAALSGGIWANKMRPDEFFYQNIMIGTMVMHEACNSGAEQFIVPMGGCSYPASAPSPIREEEMWNGYPQPESAPYAIAKKMNLVQSEACRRQYGFNSIVLIPGNMYGPHDNFNLQDAHVIPALIRRVYEAKRDGVGHITVWGTGRAVRDFVYVADVAEALVVAAEIYSSSEPINISSGTQVTIRELVESIVRELDYCGEIVWDTSKPEGQIYKGFDVTRMKKLLGYECTTSLEEGLRKSAQWFAQNYSNARL